MSDPFSQAAYDMAMGLDVLKSDPLGPLALELAQACSDELSAELNAVRLLEVLRRHGIEPPAATPLMPLIDKVMNTLGATILLSIEPDALTDFHRRLLREDRALADRYEAQWRVVLF